MAQLEFPDNPNTGDTHIHGPKVWRYGGEGWICISDTGTQIWYSDTAPVDYGKYPIWFDTSLGDLKVIYEDVDSIQWIKLGPGGAGAGAGASYLNDLLDVDLTGLGTGNVIEFDGTKWIPAVPSSGAIDDLSDVDTTTSAPNANDLLRWVSPNWVPYTLVTTNWDTAYTHSQSAHAPTDADNTSANETSHTDVVQDGDFSVNGLMIRSGAGVYATTPDNHLNWDTAYTHSQATHAPSDADKTSTNETSHDDVVVDGDFGANGVLERTSLGIYTTTLNKKDATAAPTVNDDSGGGYSVSSRWFDVTNDKEYVCLDSTVGAAVWVETTATGGAGGDVYLANENTFTNAWNIFSNGAANIGMDSDDLAPDGYPYKRITANDGGGNWNFRAGSYYSTTDKYAVTGDGATNLRHGMEGVDGYIELLTAPTGTAGNTITYNNTLLVSSSTGVVITGIYDLGSSAGAWAGLLTFGGVAGTDEEAIDASGAKIKAGALILTNAESTYHTGVSGLLIHDENFYSDTAYGTDVTDIFSTDGGGLIEYSSDIFVLNGVGYAAYFNTHNMKFATPIFEGMKISGSVLTVNNQQVIDVSDSIDALNDVDTTTITPTTSHYLKWDGVNWAPAIGGGGASSWIDLTDTDPTTFIDQKGKSVVVNQAENGLEFGTQGNIVYQDEISFGAGRTTDFSVTASGAINVIFDNVHYNIGDAYDETTGQFTAPIDGTYSFNYTFRLDSHNTGGFSHELIVGGGTRTAQYETSLSTTYQPYTGGADVYLLAGQTARVQINSVSDTIYHLDFRCNFSGHLISPLVTVAPNGITHAFSVHKNSEGVDQDIDTGTFTKVTWSDAEYESNVGFDFTNNEFVIPSTGIWAFSCHIDFAGTTSLNDQAITSIFVDGVSTKLGVRNRAPSTSAIGTMVTAEMDLQAGQKISIEAIHSNAGAVVQHEQSNTFFSGYKVSGTSTGVEYDNYDIAFNVPLVDPDAFTAGVIHEVNFGTTIFDKGGNLDTTNNKFIAPVSGVYSFGLNTRTQNLDDTDTASYIQTFIYVNGVIGDFLSTDGNPLKLHHQQNMTGLIELSAGDYITIHMRSKTDATWTLDGNLTGHLIGSTTKAEFSFHMYLDADQSLTTSGAWQKINLNNKRFDYGNNVDTITNNRIDIPEDGRYIFNFSVGFKGLVTTTSNFTSSLRVNGSIVSNGNRGAGLASTTLNNVSNGSVILDLVKSDYVELYAFQDESSSEIARGLGDITFISGYRLVSSQDTPKVTKDLSDVSSQQAGVNDVLMYNGTEYAPSNIYNDEVSFRTSISAQNITGTGVYVKILLSTYTFDNGNNVDLDNDQFVAPVDGTYQFHSWIRIDNFAIGTTNYIHSSFYVNGIQYSRTGLHNDMSSNYEGIHFEELMELSAGDIVDIRLLNAGDSDYDISSSGSHFNGHLISPSVVLAPNGIIQAFSVHKNSEGAHQAIDTATWTKITWSDAENTSNVSFDFTNNEFIVPSTGWWDLVAALDFNDTQAVNDQGIVALYIDGVEFKIGLRSRVVSSGGNIGSVVDTKAYLEAGQKVSVYGYHTNAGATITYLKTYTHFSAHKISGTSTGIEYDNYDIGFRVGVGAQYTQTVGTGLPHTAELDTIDFDKGGNFDTTNYKFIAPVDGLYHFDAMHHAIAVVDQERVLVKIRINNVDKSFDESSISTATSSNVVCSVGDTYNLAAGDEVDLELQISGEASIRDTGNLTYLSGYLVEGTTKAECSFNANLSTSQVLTVSGNTIIELDSTEFNYGNGFDIATNRFVAPEDGRYVFSFALTSLTISIATTDFFAYIKLNGVTTIAHGNRSAPSTNTYVGSTGSVITELTKGDYVELFVYQTESTSETISGDNQRTYFSGYRLVSSQDVATSIGELTNVDTTGLITGDLLKWDGTNFVPITGATGTFLSGDGTAKTITVTNGVITSIV